MILEENTLGDLGEMGITGEVGFQERPHGETMSSQALQYVYELLVHRWGLLSWVWAIDSCCGASRKCKVEQYESQFCFVVGTKFFLVWSCKVVLTLYLVSQFFQTQY